MDRNFLHQVQIFGLGVKFQDGIAAYLNSKIKNFKIDIFTDILAEFNKLYPLEKDEILERSAQKIARCRVLDLNRIKDIPCEDPLFGEIDFEKRNMQNPEKIISGLMYDGFLLQSVFLHIIKRLNRADGLSILIINRLIGTWDENDLRYHARIITFGNPCIISIPGIIEAPARPREYYVKKRSILGSDSSAAAFLMQQLDEKYKDCFICYDDPRILDILKGYIMQAVFYKYTGNPFCTDKLCRLYNAHWQEEMINAQVNKKSEFCKGHDKELSLF